MSVSSDIKFYPITSSSKKIIDEFTAKYPPYSDFGFLSLFTYNTKGTTAFALINNNLVVKFEDYITGESFFSLLGTTEVAKTVQLLIKLSIRNRMEASLNMTPEVTIEAAPNLHETYEITEDRDNFDYMVSVPAIAELQVDEFPKKRKVLDKLMATYSSLRAENLDLTNTKIQKQVIQLFDRWAESGNKTKEDVEIEYTAIARLLKYASIFYGLYAIGIYDDTQLVAFNSFEVTQSNFGVSSFQKAERKYEGIYVLLTHEVGKRLQKLGVAYVNFEQDLGIGGLRSSKLSWHPVSYLKKYTVKQK